MSVLGKNVLHKLEKIPLPSAKDDDARKQQENNSISSAQQELPEEQVMGLWQDGGLFDQLEGESFYGMCFSFITPLLVTNTGICANILNFVSILDSDLFIGVDMFSNYLMVPELLGMPLQDNLQ